MTVERETEAVGRGGRIIGRLVQSVVVALLAVGCVVPGSRGAQGEVNGGQAARPAPKRIVAAVMANPATVFLQAAAGTPPGSDVLDMLVDSGLTALDGRATRTARLAEEVPTVENGLWKLLPDGRMETTWRIRKGATWHDGRPLTAEDLVFAVEVGQDRELARFVNANLRFVESVETPDPQTVTVRWNQPYINADAMFSQGLVPPLPRHLLETPFRQGKANWDNLPYWNTEFVGTGPFRVTQWEAGAYLVLEAFDQYLLGRPKVDAIEVRFIPDGNTLVANLMAGTIDMTLGRTISVEQATELDRWAYGKVEVTPVNLVRAFWQALTPDPPVLRQVEFRRALLRATDREEMAQAIQNGVAPAAYSVLPSGAYPQIETRLPRYEYDPRAAAALLEGLGYRPGPDGILRDAAGERLRIGLVVGDLQDFLVKSAFAMADYFKKVGVEGNVTLPAPDLGTSDKLKFQAEWPGLTVIRGSTAPDYLPSLRGSQSRLPQNGFNGSNWGRYMNPELDGLIDRYTVTIPIGERNQVLAETIQLISDQLVLMPLFYGAEPAAVAHRLVNVGARPVAPVGSGNAAWNAHEWDVK